MKKRTEKKRRKKKDGSSNEICLAFRFSYLFLEKPNRQGSNASRCTWTEKHRRDFFLLDALYRFPRRGNRRIPEQDRPVSTRNSETWDGRCLLRRNYEIKRIWRCSCADHQTNLRRYLLFVNFELHLNPSHIVAEIYIYVRLNIARLYRSLCTNFKLHLKLCNSQKFMLQSVSKGDRNFDQNFGINNF